MGTASTAQLITRACGSVLLAVTAAYLLFAVAPFYANGINLHSYREIAGSFVDMKNYPPFTWPVLGGAAQAIAMLSAGYMPWLSALLMPILVMALLIGRHSHGRREASFWIAVCAAALLALSLTWSIHTTLMIWLVD